MKGIPGVAYSFKTRIFATVMLVALLPILVCDIVMLPLVVSGSEQNLSLKAQESLNAAASAFSALTLRIDEQINRLAQSDEAVKALQNTDEEQNAVYRLLYDAAFVCAQDEAAAALTDINGKRKYTVNDSGQFTALSADWGLLREAALSDKTVYSSENGLFFAAKKAGAGFIVIAVSAAGLNTLLGSFADSSNDLILLDAFWHSAWQTRASLNDDVAQNLRLELLSSTTPTGGDEYRCYVVKDEKSSFILALRQPCLFTAGVMNTFYAVFISTGILCLALCLWGAWILSRHLFAPIKELSQAMGRVEKGELNVSLESNRRDELGSLANSFNRMVENYRLYLDRSVQRQKELNNTQLRMMQAQLNPHFLYNTLDSMKWLGVTHHIPQVATLATDLAAILRASISDDEFVTLEREVELIDRYIDIQSIRFEDRFTCEIAVSEEFQSCIVPKLVLQPIVENAVIHGVGDLEDGYIKIWAEDVSGTLILYVSDNGRGMEQEIIDKLNEGPSLDPKGHLGLYNVNSIIRLHFGNQYGISAYSRKNGGSCVSVRLPLMRKESDPNV